MVAVEVAGRLRGSGRVDGTQNARAGRPVRPVRRRGGRAGAAPVGPRGSRARGCPWPAHGRSAHPGTVAARRTSRRSRWSDQRLGFGERDWDRQMGAAIHVRVALGGTWRRRSTAGVDGLWVRQPRRRGGLVFVVATVAVVPEEGNRSRPPAGAGGPIRDAVEPRVERGGETRSPATSRPSDHRRPAGWAESTSPVPATIRFTRPGDAPRRPSTSCSRSVQRRGAEHPDSRSRRMLTPRRGG